MFMQCACVRACMHVCRCVCVKLVLGFIERKYFHKFIKNLTSKSRQHWSALAFFVPSFSIPFPWCLLQAQGLGKAGQCAQRPRGHALCSSVILSDPCAQDLHEASSFNKKYWCEKNRDPPRRGGTFGEGTIEWTQCGTSQCEQGYQHWGIGGNPGLECLFSVYSRLLILLSLWLSRVPSLLALRPSQAVVLSSPIQCHCGQTHPISGLGRWC